MLLCYDGIFLFFEIGLLIKKQVILSSGNFFLYINLNKNCKKCYKNSDLHIIFLLNIKIRSKFFIQNFFFTKT